MPAVLIESVASGAPGDATPFFQIFTVIVPSSESGNSFAARFQAVIVPANGQVQ